MILSVDIGNTTVTLGGVRQKDDSYQIVFTQKMDTLRDWTAPECTRGIRGCLDRAGHKPEEIQGVVISCVVPPVLEPVRESVQEIFGVDPMVVSPECDLGITLAVPHPDQVGRDRLVDAAWAAREYGGSVVTVDLGTATTFNVISDGVFLGGVIAAGIETGLRALSSRTAQLPAVALKAPERVIGRNTSECMLAGAVIGTAGLLDGVLSKIEQELEKPVTLLITGGGGEYVCPYVRHAYVHDPHVILKGLAYLYQRNQR